MTSHCLRRYLCAQDKNCSKRRRCDRPALTETFKTLQKGEGDGEDDDGDDSEAEGGKKGDS